VSQVFLWSSARIAGVPIGAIIRERGETLERVREKIESSVRYANITIIEGNDASQFALASSRHGSQRSFFATNERYCRSEATMKGSA